MRIKKYMEDRNIYGKMSDRFWHMRRKKTKIALDPLLTHFIASYKKKAWSLRFLTFWITFQEDESGSRKGG